MMKEKDRLTKRVKGIAYYKDRFADDAPCGGGNPGEACAGCKYAERQCERLAAYEDTRLSPEEIMALMAEEKVD